MTTLSTQIDLAALRERSRRSLYFFAKGVLGYDLIVPHIHGPICENLENLAITTKMFVLPRSWLKTTLCTIAFPIWLSIQEDDHIYGGRNARILVMQNSHANACKKLAVIAGQWMKNDLLRALFPTLLPGKSERWSADSLCLSRSKDWAEATYEAAGTNTKVTSRHYNVIIEDDTVAPDLDELGEESLAPTTTDVENAIGWHRKNVIPLLNNPKTDLSLVVGTRWYDQDLIRWIMDNEPHYQVTTRACRENEHGEPDFRGQLTYPERFDAQVLERTERSMGPYMFSCLYMNTPVRREDMAFKPEWFVDYDTHPAIQMLAVYTTVDVATDPKLSKTGDVDYSVVMTCGKDLSTGLIYVLDYTRERCNPGRLCEMIFQHVHTWSPVVVGYEDVAFQRSIDYYLREMMRKLGKFFILQPLDLSRKKDAKEMRIAGLQPLFANQSIYTRSHMNELKSELLKFPLGAHDDTADALSMQTVLWRATRLARERRINMADEPFTFENVVGSIKRKSSGNAGPVFDPARCGPLGFIGRASA